MSGENVQETQTTEEAKVVESTEGTEENKTTALDAMSADELKEYVKTLRKENASHRTAKQAKTKELEEFQAWKDSQKSELEKVTERNATLEKDNLSLLKTSLAIGAGLGPEDVEFISGDTPEEMKASATKLASRLKPGGDTTTQTTNVFAGTRGAAVSEGTKDPKTVANEYMAQLIWGTGR